MTMPRSPVATEELIRQLGPMLRASLTGIEREEIPHASSFPLERVIARLPDGRTRRLVFKDISRTGPDDPAWRIKADFLHDPAREIETYLRVLGPCAISAPQCIGATIDPARGRFWLFLEEIEGEPLWQIGDPAVWQEAASWLARMHARMAGGTRNLPARLLVHDAGYHGRWLERARRFVRWPAEDGGEGRDFEWLAGRVLETAAWAATRPRTFLHGEFYPSNVLIEKAADRTRVRPVDWEMAALGPGLSDLAALISGAWEESERESLALAYREALPRDLRPSPTALFEDLNRYRLLLAVQWLGWSTNWQPPAEHAQDWFGTAIELAEAVPA